MIAALRSLFSAVIGPSRKLALPKSEETPKIGAYPVDYSEPSQREIDEANATCAEVLKTDHWVPVKSEVVISPKNGVQLL